MVKVTLTIRRAPSLNLPPVGRDRRTPNRPCAAWLALVLSVAPAASAPNAACGAPRIAGSNVRLKPSAFSSPCETSSIGTATLPPEGPVAGATRTVRSSGVTVNGAVRTSSQPVLLIVIGPLTASLGTTAVIVVLLTTEKVAVTLLANLTPLTPVKFAPLIVTVAPGEPLVGLTPETVGQGC